MLSAKRMLGLVVLVMVATVVLSSVGFAAVDANKPAVVPQKVALQGTVSVAYDANDVITSVSLTADGTVYNVVLDEKGIELGKEMANEEVKVKGVVSETDGQQWITVRIFKAVEKEKEV